MREKYNIGEVADLLQIPASRLRFWESAGLFSVGKGTNHYREYSLGDVINIADTISFRELGFPIERIAQIHNASIADHEDLLKASECELEKKLSEYRHQLKRTRLLQNAISDLKELFTDWPRTEPVPFTRVIRFDYADSANILRYIKDPMRYVRFMDTSDPHSETRGIIADRIRHPAEKEILWTRRDHVQTISFPIREKPDQNYATDLFDSLKVIRSDYTVGILLARYVFTANENGERTDFYKGFLEVIS